METSPHTGEAISKSSFSYFGVGISRVLAFSVYTRIHIRIETQLRCLCYALGDAIFCALGQT